MEADYDVGSALKEKIIPHAVEWFTGEAAELEDEDFDDEGIEEDDEEEEDDEDDDEDDEDDDDTPQRGRKGAAGRLPARVSVGS
jgi:nucleosome assembly protein 1-like 1